MAGYPSSNVHRVARHRLGRGQSVQLGQISASVVASLPPTALAASLAAYYSFGTGGVLSLEDSSGNGNTLSQSAVTAGVGKIDNAAVFVSANNSRMSSPLRYSAIYPSFSFNVWFKITILGNRTGLLGFHESTGNEQTYLIIYSLGVPPRVVQAGMAQTAGPFFSLSDGTSLAINQWHMATFTWDDAAEIGYLYFDGSLSTSGSGAKHTENLFASLVIGSPITGTAMALFDGFLSGVGVWSRVLSSVDVTALYAGGAGLAYPFGVGVGPSTVTITFDRSVIINGIVNLHIPGLPAPTSQTVVSQTEVVQVYPTSVSSLPYFLDFADPAVRGFQGNVPLPLAGMFS